MGVLFAGGSEGVVSTTTYARPTTDCSVSMWLRHDNNSAGCRPFGHDTNFESRTGAGGSVLTLDYFGTGVGGTVTLTLGTYHHLVFVCDVTGGNMLAYLDGSNVLNAAASFTTAGTDTMKIGISPGAASQGWNGALDDIRIYNRALSAAECENLYACRGTDGMLEDLEHWYPMDEGAEGATVTTIYDHVASGAIDCGNVTGTPTYNYDAGIKRRRIV